MRSSLSSANTPVHTLTHSHSHFKAPPGSPRIPTCMPPTVHLAFSHSCLTDSAPHASTASLAARLAHHGRERLAVLAQPARQRAQRTGPRAQLRADPQPSACTLGWPRGHCQRAPSSSAASSQAAALTGPSAFLPHPGQQLPAFGGGTWTFTPASSPPAEASACASIDLAGSQTSARAEEASTASQGHAPPARAARR